MKKLTQKVIEAGLVEEGTQKLMAMWGLTDLSEDLNKTKEKVKKAMSDLVDDIAALIEESTEIPEIRETELSLVDAFESNSKIVHVIDGKKYETVAVVDRANKIIFKKDAVSELIRSGTVVEIENSRYEVLSIELRYVEENPAFLVCEVADATLPSV